MLSEQAIIAEQLAANSETMPLGFIISDDGRTLLAVTGDITMNQNCVKLLRFFYSNL